MDSQFLQAALAYADRFRWFVFPIRPRGKEPLTLHGYLDASRDVEAIRTWWHRWPDANVGIACGQSGLVIIDLDVDKGGLDTWHELCRDQELEIDTLISLTGSGGQHLVFLNPNGADIRNSAGKLGPGVDVRANGGYVVAPPSIHPSGREYVWEVTAHPADRNPAPLPAALLTLLAEDKPKAAPPLPDMIPAGRRNLMLTSLAGSMRRRGAGEGAILAALEAENARCDPPLDQAELERIAKSVARYSPAKWGQKLGARNPTGKAEEIKAIAPEPPDPELRRRIIDTLLATDSAKDKPPALLRRQQAGQIMLAWLNEHGGFVQSEIEEPFYFSSTERRLYSLETDRWRAWLYGLTGANPAGTDFAYLAADCKAAAIAAPRLPVLRVAAWDDDAQVLRVSRFDGTVYVLNGESISEEPNGQGTLFDDDSLWLPYKPDFTVPGVLHWATSELPHWGKDTAKGEALGLAFRAWVLSTFFCELCPTRPLLVFLGEKGSGKSMNLRVLLQLLFGPIGQLSGVPDKPDGFMAAAAAAHILTIDNLDEFTPWMRDRLARISTGAEDHYRKLYTSNERGRVMYRCWVAFTARTPDTLKRDDLADRLLLLPVERISEGAQQPERDFLTQALALRNAWWGDVLTALNGLVARIRRGELASTSKLRMADWESLGRLVARGGDKEAIWDTFIDGLKKSQCAFLFESDLIIDALEEWLKDETNHGRELTTRGLHEEWTAALFGDKKPSKDWFRSTKSLGRKLANIRRDLGSIYQVEWSQDRTRQTRYRFWPLAENQDAKSAEFAEFAESNPYSFPKNTGGGNLEKNQKTAFYILQTLQKG